MDALSEVLKSVKLEGALFYNGEFAAPWAFRTPASCKLAPYVPGRGNHIIIFHLLVHGRGYAGLEEDDAITLSEGDIVVFPHGDPHIVGSGRSVPVIDNELELQNIFTRGLKLARFGAGPDVTKLVCGYMSCDATLSRIFLAGLPHIFKVNIRDNGSGTWLESSIRFCVSGPHDNAPGAAAVVGKLSEVLFVETLRRYMAALPKKQTGWLAGARNPEVGRALGLIHSRASHPWTVGELARQIGVSRSVLAERFRHFLGEPPMSYLTNWRLQLGAQMLRTTSYSVAQVALEVGYESEPAFHRAFKREFMETPTQYRESDSPMTKKRAVGTL